MEKIYSKTYDAKPVAALFGSKQREVALALFPLCERNASVGEAMDTVKGIVGTSKDAQAKLAKALDIFKGAEGRKAERSARRLGL